MKSRWLVATCGALVVVNVATAVAASDASTGLDVAAEVRTGFRAALFPGPPSTRWVPVVPPREAWESGAHAWDAARRLEFVKSQTVRSVGIGLSAAGNVQRADRDPAQWLPTQAFRCAYVEKWIEVKKSWGLSADAAEIARLRRILSACRTLVPSTVASIPVTVPGTSVAVSTTVMGSATTSTSTSSSTTAPRSPSSAVTSAPSTTVAPVAAGVTTTTPVKMSMVREELASIRIIPEYTVGYDRDLFPHWKDVDRDGCDTREEVLIRDSRTPVQLGASCKVLSGTWYSPYDGATWSNPSDIDIDHVVALNEAWQSGAYSWTRDQRTNYANDLSDGRTLLAVTDSVNRSKSDKDPGEWLPPLVAYRCTYLADWVAVKKRWGLAMDEAEYAAVTSALAPCP